MKKHYLGISAGILFASLFVKCGQHASETTAKSDSTSTQSQYGGYANQVKWGEHIVSITGCNDCHTPKKMTPEGPAPDMSLMLSGHPAQMPAPDVNRKEMESKGLAVTNDLTAWVGPWGISYAANLTPDSSGIGGWKEDQFIYCIRQGKFKGLPDSRPLLPPMPWQEIRNMTDDELKAVFAYLKTIKPISNVVPAAVPPVSAPRH
jgi:hypothetical protein